MDAGGLWDGSPVLDLRKLLEGTVESGISRSCVLLDEGRPMPLQARDASIYPWRGTDLCHPGATGDAMRCTRLVGRKYLPCRIHLHPTRRLASGRVFASEPWRAPFRNASSASSAVRVGCRPRRSRARPQSIGGSRRTASNRCGETGTAWACHAAESAVCTRFRGTLTTCAPSCVPRVLASITGCAARSKAPRTGPG